MAEAGAEEAPAAPADLAPAPVASTSGSAAGSWPDFAVVCSFLERYGAALDLPELTFPELEDALEQTGAVSRALVELHLKLMRKIGKSVTFDRWEKYLIRICQDYNSTWAWEMEKKGYLEMSVECKVGLLKHLCECQFDDNLKFKNAINEEDADAMRVQPIGRDKDGLMYWYQLDQDHNIRIYIEEQDDQDGSTWKCIVRTRNELAEILELLKAQIDPALLKKSEPEENSSQNPNPDNEEIKKQENGEKSAEDVEMKEEKPDVANKRASESPTENGSSCKTDGERSRDIKTEPSSDTEEGKPSAKEKDSFKENIKPVKTERKDEKTEPKDLKESKGSSEKTPSPQDQERAEVSVIVKRTEEHVEKPVEDTEKIKNDQQAKIPLKKRELKLTDDFDGPVKAAMCKSKTPTKELLQKEEGKSEDDGTKAAAADGKQLVNGEVNSDKVHKAKADHPEDVPTAAPPPRESVIECTKDENGITNEKRNSSVIKSLQELKNGKPKVVDGFEKSTSPIDLTNDRGTPPVQESSKKASSTAETTEVDSSKSGAGTKADKKLDTEKEKPPQKGMEKDSSLSEVTKESEAVVEIPPAESKEVSQMAEQKVEELEADGGKKESESKAKDGRNRATKARLTVSKKSTTRNSAAKKEKPSEDLEKADNDVKEEPAPTKKAETDEKHPAAIKEKKTFPLRSKRKTGVKDVDTSESKEADKAEAVEEDQEKTPQKPSLISRSKNRLKTITEEENSGSEGGKEMTSERQKDGIKLTIRISNKRRRPELPVENVAVEDAEEAESEENIGRRLRRSPRISRPSAKVVEVKPRKPEKKQSDEEESPPPAKLEEEEKKSEKEPSQKIKKKPKPRRRARWTNTRSRRKRKSSSEEETEDSDSEEDSEEGSEDEEKEGVPGEDDEPCKKCGLPNHPELILLCDSCDSGYHTACLRPPLMLIPDGEWFCPPCQHKLLCEKLEEQLQNLDVVLKKKERAERRKERLVYVGISIENIIPSQEPEELQEVTEKEEKKKKKAKPLERRSTRARKFISYRFDEFDEAIDEAIEDDIRDADGGGGGGGGRGKDMSNITGHRGKDISTILEGEREREEGKRPQRTVARRKKRRRLNDLDSDSNMDEEESEDEFRISEGSQEEFVVTDENVEESDDQQSNDSDFGARRPRRHYSRPMRQSRRIKRRSVRRRYSDDDEDDDDDSEEESPPTETDNSSDYSDDYLDTRRRRSRRNQKRQVNYKEDSESDSSKKGTRQAARHGRGKEMRRVLKRRFSSSESNESDFSPASDDEKPRTVRKNLLRKRIRSSNDELSDEEEEEEKPVRKRLNRIETDEEDDEEEGDAKVCSSNKPPEEEKPPAVSAVLEGAKKPCYRIESDDEDDFENVTKDGSPLDYSLVDLPSANGQSPGKTIETFIGKPSEKSETTKDISAPVSQASNGTGGGQEAAGAEEDEDELLRVTDLVDYVCNSEQL